MGEVLFSWMILFDRRENGTFKENHKYLSCEQSHFNIHKYKKQDKIYLDFQKQQEEKVLLWFSWLIWQKGKMELFIL